MSVLSFLRSISHLTLQDINRSAMIHIHVENTHLMRNKDGYT